MLKKLIPNEFWCYLDWRKWGFGIEFYVLLPLWIQINIGPLQLYVEHLGDKNENQETN